MKVFRKGGYMKRKSSILLGSLVATLLASSTVLTAYACTGVIIGSDLTEDGSTIFGRTEDLEVNHNKAYKVHEAGEHKTGETIKDVSVDEKNGYSFTFTHDSYRYTSVSDTTPEYGNFDETGFNDKGLIADMTVSASANEDVLKADPYLDGTDSTKPIGITEAIITTAVLGSCDNAKDAVEFIANEVATKGAAEGNGLVVADHDELWYMEIYTGHQFVAIKYPKDKFSVFPNSFWLNDCTLTKGEEQENFLVSEDGNYIYSKDIFKVALDAKTFQGDEEKREINLYASYAPKELRDSTESRVCSGIKQFNPDAKFDGKVYPFLETTGKKLGLKDAFAFTRNRLETIDKVGDDLHRGDLYPIGNRNTMEAHIYHIPSGATAEDPGTMWLALGSPLVSPFVPYYPNQTAGIEEAGNEENSFNENSVYWLAMDTLFMIEYDRKELQPIATKKIAELEDEELKNAVTSALSPEDSTKRNQEDAGKAFEVLKEIHTEVKAKFQEYLKENDYTIEYVGKKTTEDFTDSTVKVEKGSADIGLKLQVSPEEDGKSGTLELVDFYGNPVKEVSKELLFTIPTAAFSEKAVFYAQDGKTELKAEEKEGKYVFSTKDVKVTYRLASSGENKEEKGTTEAAETGEKKEETKETKKMPTPLPLIAAAVIVVGAAVVMQKKKKQ